MKTVNPYDLSALAIQRAIDRAKKGEKPEPRHPYTLSVDYSLQVQMERNKR